MGTGDPVPQMLHRDQQRAAADGTLLLEVRWHRTGRRRARPPRLLRRFGAERLYPWAVHAPSHLESLPQARHWIRSRRPLLRCIPSELLGGAGRGQHLGGVGKYLRRSDRRGDQGNRFAEWQRTPRGIWRARSSLTCVHGEKRPSPSAVRRVGRKEPSTSLIVALIGVLSILHFPDSDVGEFTTPAGSKVRAARRSRVLFPVGENPYPRLSHTACYPG